MLSFSRANRNHFSFLIAVNVDDDGYSEALLSHIAIEIDGFLTLLFIVINDMVTAFGHRIIFLLDPFDIRFYIT